MIYVPVIITIDLFFILVFLAAPVWACETKIYTTKGSAIVVGGDQDKARQSAGQMAEQAALDDALAHIGLDSLLANFHLSGNTNTLIPYLKVDTSEVLHESVSRPKDSSAPQIYSLELKTPICKDSKDPMPEFKISVELNKPAFFEGDEMFIRIRASQDCQYAIYFVTEDQGVLRLIPSRAKQENALKAGQTITFPDKEDAQRGIHLRTHVASPGKSTTETLFAMALRDTKFETTETMDEAIFGLYDGQTLHLRDLVRRVAAIPLEHRTEYIVRYVIRPKP